MFIHKAYTRRLNSMELGNAAAGLRYTVPTNNMYHVIEGDIDDNDSATDNTVAMIAAAATTGSTLGTGTAASTIHPGFIEAINQSIVPAFNQMVQNQSILQNQIAAMLLAQPPQPRSYRWFNMLHSLCNSHFSCPCSSNSTSKQCGMDVASKANSRVDVADKEAMDRDVVVVKVNASIILPLQQLFATSKDRASWCLIRDTKEGCLHPLIHLAAWAHFCWLPKQ
jgi:hypothetical protein